MVYWGGGMEQQLVVFRLDGEQYGVQITNVESIIKRQPVTRLPNTETYIEGITNLRGRILPVIDLRKRLGLPPSASTGSCGSGADKDSRIVVVSFNDMQVGMMVDAVSEVTIMQDEQFEPAPAMAVRMEGGMVRGIAKLDDAQQPVILLDLAAVLSVQDREKAAHRRTS
jgi:purine-binding chemotaxis protein CheW